MEYFALALETIVVTAAIVVPIRLVLKPRLSHYTDFLSVARFVHLRHDSSAVRWLPHYFGTLFFSYVLTQAVACFLQYPLLYDKLNASILQIGILDAGTTVVNIAASMGPLARLPRAHTFLVQAVVSVIGYSLLIGIAVPRVGHGWFALLIVFAGQAVAGLPLAFAEFGVMRNDAKQDIIEDESVCKEWKDEDEVQAMLCQFQVVLKYPASVIGSMIFPPMLNICYVDVCEVYALVGCASACLYAILFWCWKGHTRAHHTRKAHQMPMQLGYYFTILLRLGAYTAVLSIVRNGYVRILNLRVLQIQDVTSRQLGYLIGIVYGVSICFFWLSDIATARPDEETHENGAAEPPASEEPSVISFFDVLCRCRYRKAEPAPSEAREKTRARMRTRVPYLLARRRTEKTKLFGKLCAGWIGFALMAVGHLGLGVAHGFPQLAIAALFFGFGQAITTGLGTVWKDELRDLLREEGRDPAFEKLVMSYLGGVTVVTDILNSLCVGVLGHQFGLQSASFFYATVGLLGFLATFKMRVEPELILVAHAQRDDAQAERGMPLLQPIAERKGRHAYLHRLLVACDINQPARQGQDL